MTGVEQFHDAQVGTAHAQGDLQQRFEVEVDIGDSGEQGLFHHGTDTLVRFAQAASVVGIGSQALDTVQDHLLHRLHIRILAAHAHAVVAPGSTISLFTLVTKHHGSFTFVVPGSPRLRPETAAGRSRIMMEGIVPAPKPAVLDLDQVARKKIHR